MGVRQPLLHWLLFLVKKWDLPPSFSTSNPLIRKSSQNWASCIFWGHLISWDLWKKFLFSPQKHRRVPWLSSHGMEAEAATFSWLPDPESAFPLLRESKRNPENFVSDGTKILGTSIGLWVDLSFPLLISSLLSLKNSRVMPTSCCGGISPILGPGTEFTGFWGYNIVIHEFQAETSKYWKKRRFRVWKSGRVLDPSSKYPNSRYW